MKPRYLYVHAPFCVRRCAYCDFAVQVAAEPPVAAWAASLGRELELVAAEHGWADPLALETLYVGGGTPSVLGTGALARLRRALAPMAALDDVVELTVEANPESFTPELARDWAAAGVNRVSFGAQTFHAPSLRWMGRMHGPEGPGRAVAAARAAGIDNLGLDLIFGLPDRLGRDLDADLDRVLALEPDHVSVYGLSVEPDTPLGRWVRSGRERVPEQERYRDEYLTVAERLRSEGYLHYEVSNFARPGRESRHNGAYWRGVPYIGLGNGAHSFVGARRWWNRRDWPGYLAAVERGESPRDADETVGPAEARLERLWLGLRTREGLERAELEPGQAARVDRWIAAGLAESVAPGDGREDGGQVRLTVEGWLLLDRLTVELDGAADGSLEKPSSGRQFMGLSAGDAPAPSEA